MTIDFHRITIRPPWQASELGPRRLLAARCGARRARRQGAGWRRVKHRRSCDVPRDPVGRNENIIIGQYWDYNCEYVYYDYVSSQLYYHNPKYKGPIIIGIFDGIIYINKHTIMGSFLDYHYNMTM